MQAMAWLEKVAHDAALAHSSITQPNDLPERIVVQKSQATPSKVTNPSRGEPTGKVVGHGHDNGNIATAMSTKPISGYIQDAPVITNDQTSRHSLRMDGSTLSPLSFTGADIIHAVPKIRKTHISDFFSRIAKTEPTGDTPTPKPRVDSQTMETRQAATITNQQMVFQGGRRASHWIRYP
ncbi:uncharacterized protein N0V89_005091 [Didymosphaeria variabile]|uniref:Uncharacterized protein n=1 Tax=Didymosphaeria variabile TaxID=1932322 RepID=A0A9W9CAW3_9PLEO|nr:uncharacterized protein N0V89_005091 [Didymosphaeria variabile]KAJ4353362.1 hypothetical protein N0V89_005091 [Didymosphaeria variabile]